MKNKRKSGTIWETAVVAAVYFLVWWAVGAAVGKELLLPSPIATLRRFFQLLLEAESWLLAVHTLLRILAGYGTGVALGALLAVLTARFAFADALLSPLSSIVKATPVTSFILLALLWLSSNAVPVFIVVLMVTPIVWTNTLEAIRGVDVQLLEMARLFAAPVTAWKKGGCFLAKDAKQSIPGFTPWKTLRHIYLPSVRPQFLAACTTALGFAWKSGVAAEIIALPQRSIGYRLYQSKLHIETLDLFAWTLLVVLLSMLLEWLLKRALGRRRHD